MSAVIIILVLAVKDFYSAIEAINVVILTKLLGCLKLCCIF